jgi:micrococcal nuclease
MGWWESLISSSSSLSFPSAKDYPFLQDTKLAVEEHLGLVIPPHVQDEWNRLSSTQLSILGTACGIAFVMGVRVGRIRPVWKRYNQVLDIPSNSIGSDSSFLKGRAITVSDGDTIRFLHTPTWFHPTSLQEGEKASEVALAVRICTIDTPETAKFGKPGQPYGPEAKEYLSKLLLTNNNVYIQLLAKDQYGRAVAQVCARPYSWIPFYYHYADEYMLQAGLAEVYQGGGAVYGRKGKQAYEAMEQVAQKKLKGMWAQGEKRESAAEYKART